MSPDRYVVLLHVVQGPMIRALSLLKHSLLEEGCLSDFIEQIIDPQ